MTSPHQLKEAHWVCTPCGLRHGSRPCAFRMSTYHHGTCEVCGNKDAVTETRDFGYLDPDTADS